MFIEILWKDQEIWRRAAVFKKTQSAVLTKEGASYWTGPMGSLDLGAEPR